MLIFDLNPGLGLGPFPLGVLVQDVVAYIKSSKEYQCVEVKVSEDENFELCFPDHGFKLVFEGRSQRLRRAEVSDASRLHLRCGPSSLFGGAANPPTYEGLSAAFGPTFENEVDQETGLQPLLYPGFMALFEPGPAESGEPTGLLKGAPSTTSTPQGPAVRICIFAGTVDTVGAALRAPPPMKSPATATTAQQAVDVVPGQGAYFSGSKCTIRLGDSAQDVITELGEPDAVYHKRTLSNPQEGVASDYFFNYFTRGIDVMLSGVDHRVQKLIFRANPVLHPDFGLYSKCNFRVHVETGFALPCYALDAHSDDQTPPSTAAEINTLEAAPSLAQMVQMPHHTSPNLPLLNGSSSSPTYTNGSSSRISAACNMLADLMDGAFGQTSSDNESPRMMMLNGGGDGDGNGNMQPTQHQTQSSKKKAARRRRKNGQSMLAAESSGGESPGSQFFSPGTSPATQTNHFFPPGRPPKPPGGNNNGNGGALLGSASSSAADLTRHERRWEVGSQYRDGWSDGEDLTQLVSNTNNMIAAGGDAGEVVHSSGDGGALPTVCSVAVQTLYSDADASFPAAETLYTYGEQVEGQPLDSPVSFVHVEEAESNFGNGDDDEDFENITKMRTCSTQTAQTSTLPFGSPFLPPANLSLPAPVPGKGHIVGVDSGVQGIEAAFGKLGKGAINNSKNAGQGPSFPPTRLFGFPSGVVFEVLSNGSIASLTVFRS